MNAVKIEEAVTELAENSFDAAEFPYQVLAAFGNKDTTIKRLRAKRTVIADQAAERVLSVLAIQR